MDVNNAGITRFQRLREITAETMDSMYYLNYRGMILGGASGRPRSIWWKTACRARFCLTPPSRGFAPHSVDGVYGGLKAGLNRTIASFAIDLGRYGIRVNGFRRA